MYAIGADIDMVKAVLYALDYKGEPVKEFNKLFRRTRLTEDGLRDVREWLLESGQEYCILVENSTKTHHMAWMMESLGISFIVGHSTDLRQITKSDSKTDDIDAEKLASYMLARLHGANQFHVSYYCDKETMRRRTLCRMAKKTVTSKGACKRRIRMYAHMFGLTIPSGDLEQVYVRKSVRNLEDPELDMMLDELEQLIERSKMQKKRIETEFRGRPIYERIQEIPGFGPITSAYLDALICDIGRFPNAKAFQASLGVVPRVFQSGEKDRNGKITKKGEPHARWLLYQAVSAHVRDFPDSPVTRFFNRLNDGSIEERKARHEKVLMKRDAMIAASRKMAAIIYTLLSKDRHW